MAAWPLALIGLILSYWIGGRWLGWRRIFIGVLAFTTLFFLAAVAKSIFDDLNAPASAEGQAKAAAIARVRAQFASPESVKFDKLWVGNSSPLGLFVCGVADSPSLANPSRFIFMTDPLAPQTQPEKPDADRIDYDLTFEFPPTLKGANQKDPAYWDAIIDSRSGFDARWVMNCTETKQPGDGSESQ